MFKTKITLLDINWDVIDYYKSNFKPSVGEFIFSKVNDRYYEVTQVIHSLEDGFDLILVVNPVDYKKMLKINGKTLVSE